VLRVSELCVGHITKFFVSKHTTHIYIMGRDPSSLALRILHHEIETYSVKSFALCQRST